jgi:hypothetical protein
MTRVPIELTGLWRREVITAPGFRDETTQVLWLQTASWYADIRVPAERPSADGRASLAEFADAELLELARLQGFAGELSVADGVCFWRRDLDHQPLSASPDEGRFTLDGEVMIEDGIHADYQEIWRREPQSRAPLAAFRLEGDPVGREGLLVIGGRHLLEFVARPGPAPQGESLRALVEAHLSAGRRGEAEALLSTRIRHATADGDGGWTTQLSTLPWLEERPAWRPGAARFDLGQGLLVIEEDGEAARWRLLEATDAAALAALLNGVSAEGLNA